jgi:hypothetical protein
LSAFSLFTPMENLKKEFRIFKLLVLKNFPSQKHFLHFQKYSKVQRIISRLIEKDLENKQTQDNVGVYMTVLMNLFKLSCSLKATVSDAYKATRLQAQNAWFLPLNLTFMAILAKIYCIVDVLIDEQSTAYECGYRKLNVSESTRFPFKIDGHIIEMKDDRLQSVKVDEDGDIECKDEDINIDLQIEAKSNLSDQFFSQATPKAAANLKKKKKKKGKKRPSTILDDIDSIFGDF